MTAQRYLASGGDDGGAELGVADGNACVVPLADAAEDLQGVVRRLAEVEPLRRLLERA